MGTHSLNDEAQVVEQAKSDPEAFRKLYQHYLPQIYRYAFYRTGTREQAEDVVSQTFLQAWEYLPRYEQRGVAFGSWLYRIAANIIRSQIASEIPAASLTWEPDAQTPISAGHWTDLRLDLLRWLRTLPDAQQQVLMLRYVQDLSVRQTASIMDKSEGAIKQLAWRGLNNLRERMSGYAVKNG